MPISRASPPVFPAQLGRAVTNAAVLSEALAALVVASLAIRWLPFRRTMALAGWRGAARGVRDPGPPSRRVRWAVERWADLVPWRAVCFQRGLAAQWMLRRRGIASLLHYGIDGRTAGTLSAHVWVEIDGIPLLGGAESARHTAVMVRPEPDLDAQ